MYCIRHPETTELILTWQLIKCYSKYSRLLAEHIDCSNNIANIGHSDWVGLNVNTEVYKPENDLKSRHPLAVSLRSDTYSKMFVLFAAKWVSETLELLYELTARSKNSSESPLNIANNTIFMLNQELVIAEFITSIIEIISLATETY